MCQDPATTGDAAGEAGKSFRTWLKAVNRCRREFLRERQSCLSDIGTNVKDNANLSFAQNFPYIAEHIISIRLEVLYLDTKSS